MFLENNNVRREREKRQNAQKPKALSSRFKTFGNSLNGVYKPPTKLENGKCALENGYKYFI